ncbi:MAG: hypothetical protein U5J95_10565 [Balneolaceae bacterium]|nr:hypothetical protein [Balneolaceae bacterium]
MVNWITAFFKSENKPDESFDVERVIQQIKEIEAKQDIPLGKRIHSSSHLNFDLYLDRDITKNYRITVFLGRNRIYSFSIFAQLGDYSILEKGYKQVVSFLEGDRVIKELPDNKIVKGFYYGH